MKDELEESLHAGNIVTVVEWAESVIDVLPDDRLRVEISTTGDTARHFAFTAGPQHQHLGDGS